MALASWNGVFEEFRLVSVNEREDHLRQKSL